MSIQILAVDPQFLRVPLLVIAKRTDDGYWLATSPGISTHGMGSSVEDSISDFKSMILDLFRELVGSEDRLASQLREELAHLRYVLADDNAI